MKKIFKYQVEKMTQRFFKLPEGAKFLHGGVQGGIPCAWFLVDEDNDLESRSFEVLGTGHEITNNNLEYLFTWQEPPFVWHLFEVTA